MYYKIIYLLRPKGIETWKSLSLEDNTDKDYPAKDFDKFEGSVQTSYSHNRGIMKKSTTLNKKDDEYPLSFKGGLKAY